MRTEEQVKRVAQNYGLNRQRLSILLHKRNKIETQQQLREIAFDLKRADDGLVHRLLRTVTETPHKQMGVKSSWGSMILMKEAQ